MEAVKKREMSANSSKDKALVFASGDASKVAKLLSQGARVDARDQGTPLFKVELGPLKPR